MEAIACSCEALNLRNSAGGIPPPGAAVPGPPIVKNVLTELDDKLRSLLDALFQGLGSRGHRLQLMLQPGNLRDAPKNYQMFDGLACLDTLAVADVGVPHQLINAGSRGLGGQLLVKCRELRVDPLKSPVHSGVVSVGGLGSQPPLNQGKGSPEVGEP